MLWTLTSNHAKYDKLYNDTAIATCVINGLLALPTIGLNGLIIITIIKTKSLRSASNWFLGNLMLTDLLMGLCGQPLYILARIWNLKGFEVLCGLGITERFFANTLPLTLMFTLTVSSLDRYLAIRLMLQYRVKMTSFRAIMMIIVLWLFAILCGCLLIVFGPSGFTIFLGVTFLVCLIVTFIAYFKAFHGLKRHQNQVSTSENLTCINVKKYQRSFTTMLFVFLLQLIFYTPVILSKFIIAHDYTGTNCFTMIFITDTIIYVNATLNPVFFIWRMRDVRRACKRTIKKMLKTQQ